MLAIIATALGLGIAVVDSRPTWDDTGITPASSLITTFIASALAGHRPWLWAFLVGAWVPAITIVNGGDPAALLELVFGLAGAFAGYAVSALWRRHASLAPED